MDPRDAELAALRVRVKQLEEENARLLEQLVHARRGSFGGGSFGGGSNASVSQSPPIISGATLPSASSATPSLSSKPYPVVDGGSLGVVKSSSSSASGNSDGLECGNWYDAQWQRMYHRQPG